MPLLMTRLERSEHEVHALREEIWTRPHGGPPERMRPGSHVIGDLQRKLESLENKYQLLKHAGTPSVTPIGIPTPKPEPRVRVFGVPAWEERVAGSLPGFGIPPAEDDLSSMRSDDRGFREEPQGERGVGPAPTRDTARLAWGLIGGIAPGWISATWRRMVMVGLCRGWCFSCSTDKNLSRMELGLRNKSRRDFYGQWFGLNDFWKPGKSHNLKGGIRG